MKHSFCIRPSRSADFTPQVEASTHYTIKPVYNKINKYNDNKYDYSLLYNRKYTR